MRLEGAWGGCEGGQLGKAGGRKVEVERFNSTSIETILEKSNIKDGVAKGDQYSTVGDFCGYGVQHGHSSKQYCSMHLKYADSISSLTTKQTEKKNNNKRTTISDQVR